MPSQSKHWCFTLNNYGPEDPERLLERFDDESLGITYLVFGREIAESGTPHLQGFVSFDRRRRLTFVRQALSESAHYEAARGTPKQAADYCRKDGDYSERGVEPTGQGSRNDIDRYKEWLLSFHRDHGRRPNQREIVAEFTSLFMRYSRAMLELPALLLPSPELVDGESANLNEWQRELLAQLTGTYDDRTVSFYVDTEGGKGKTWFCQYMMSQHPNDVQVLSIGKRDDMAHSLDPTKSIFLFNVPRGGMEYLQYTILEQIKDRFVFSPKYNSNTKVFDRPTAVVVFCNEEPDYSKMSGDRYNVINI